MFSPPNYLRYYRKRTPLTQEDIAAIMGYPDVSNVSRYEKSKRTPKIEMLLTYHLLFNVSVELFFEPRLETIKSELLRKIEKLLETIKAENRDLNYSSRIQYLEQVISRLTN